MEKIYLKWKFWIIISTTLVLLFMVSKIFGIGVHTKYKHPEFNFEKGVAEQESLKFFGVDRSFWRGVEGIGRITIKIIPLGSRTDIVSKYCEIEYLGKNSYSIICRKSEGSPALVPIVNKRYTKEHLKLFDYANLPHNYTSTVKITPIPS